MRAKGAIATAPPCRAADVVVWHGDRDAAGGAMSTFYTSFPVSSLAEHACSIAGFPRLFALGIDGQQIGGGESV